MNSHITGPQVRAARGLLNLSVKELSERTRLAVNTIKRAEASVGPLAITPANVALLAATFEADGIQFIPPNDGAGAGVRFATQEFANVDNRRRRRADLPAANSMQEEDG